MCMEHKVYMYKCTAGKTSFDLSVQQGVGAGVRSAKLKVIRITISKTFNSRQLSY